MAENKPGLVEKTDVWLAQNLGVHLLGVFLFYLALWIGSENSLTMAEVTQGLANMPVWVPTFALVLDYLFDVGNIHKRALGRRRAGRFIYTVVITAFAALVVAWVLTGISGLSGPLGLFIGVMFALVVLLPKTGTSAVIAWVYIAALIVEGVPPTLGIEEIKAALGVV